MFNNKEFHLRLLVVCALCRDHLDNDRYHSKHEETDRHRFVSVNTSISPENMTSGILLPDSS